MIKKYFSSLRVRLLLLIAAGFVIFVVLAGYRAYDQRAALLAKAREDVLQTAKVLAATDNHIVIRTHLFIARLTQNRRISELTETVECNRLLVATTEQTPDISNIAIALPDGQVVCSATPNGQTINIADRPYFRKALTAPGLVIGDPVVSRINGELGIPFYKAIINENGQMQGIARVLFDLSWLSNELGKAKLPKGSRVEVIDDRGIILARYPDPQQWIGKTLPDPAILKIMLTEGHGIADLRGVDGVPLVMAFTPFTETSASRLFLLVGIPREAVTGEIERTFIQNLSISLAIVLVLFASIWLFSERLVLRPIAALSAAIRRLQGGDLTARSGLPTTNGELGELVRSFDIMAESIQTQEEELIRTSRALRVLSAGNRTLLRATDEAMLLDQMCAEIVRAGGYPIAWIGFAENDPDKSVRVVASAGADAGFTRSLHISWDETERGKGPTGTAIRSGMPVTERNCQTSPRYAPWRKLALQYGYGSSLALPVRENDRIIGTLNIYAAESDAFGEKEVNLLSETAADLSYGIANLRAHAQREALEASLRASERHFLAAAEASMDALLILTGLRDNAGAFIDFTVTEANASAEKLLDRERAKIIGKKLTETFPIDAMGRGFEKYAHVATTGMPFEEDFAIDMPGIKAKWLRQQVVRMNGGIAISIRDITASKKSEERLEYLAYFDDLTDLPNRALLHDRLSQAIAEAHRNSRLVGVMFMDLDNFKIINDTLGHSEGDVLLQAVAARLKTCFREGDTVARLGGDEFAVVLPDISNAEGVMHVAHKICDRFNKPFTISGRELFVTFSIGITLYPFDDSDTRKLLRNADAAMYQAKAQGRNNCQFYSAEMTARTNKRMELERDLRIALAGEQFLLHYQPKVDLKTGLITGMEALIRWQHPEKGMISPLEFIPVAEDTGLIVQIGAWVLRTACAQTKAWLDQGLPRLVVAVNLSSRQFKHDGLVQTVNATLDETGLDPHCLELEITESLLIEGKDSTILTTLEAFKTSGITLAIDDFGTGYSSLSYLKSFPIDFLKIDRAFVRDVTADKEDASLVKAIIAMARSLQIETIAEGVETEGHLKFLRQHGCDHMQGYYFSRPLPADEFASLVNSGKSLPPEDASEALPTLLLVDDERQVLNALERLLRRDGYRILTADSAEKALELLALNEVQVVMSDARMPGTSGIEFLSKVNELYPDIVRIVLSGHVGLELLIEAVNQGAIFKCLLKPWDDTQLRQHIRQAFRVAGDRYEADLL